MDQIELKAQHIKLSVLKALAVKRQHGGFSFYASRSEIPYLWQVYEGIIQEGFDKNFPSNTKGGNYKLPFELRPSSHTAKEWGVEFNDPQFDDYMSTMGHQFEALPQNAPGTAINGPGEAAELMGATAARQELARVVEWHGGILSSGLDSYTPRQHETIALIHYLWPKREVRQGEVAAKKGSPQRKGTVAHNVKVGEERLLQMINSINQHIRRNNIKAQISRRGGILMIVTSK
jgi:hypothetical protein